MHPTQRAQWKKQVLDERPPSFEHPRSERAKDEEALIASLYQQIGQLKVEVDFLKKTLIGSVEQKRLLIEPDHAELSIVRQWERLEWARSSSYDQPVPSSEEDLFIMRL